MHGKAFNNIFYIIILCIISYSYNYIILPFKTTNIPFKDKENTTIIDNFLSQIDTNQLFTTLSFGNPAKNIDFYFSMEQLAFAVLSNHCLKGSYSTYNPTLSNTFKNQTPYDKTFGYISRACLATEKCTFYNDLKLSKNISFEEFKFLFGNNTLPKNENSDSERLCGNIGLLRYTSNEYLTMNNFIYYLKENNLTNSKKWGLFYFDKEISYNVDKDIQAKYDGLLIAGITNNSYLEIFKTENIFTQYGFGSFFWSLTFNKIYYKDKDYEYLCDNNTQVEFIIDLNYISCTRHYYDSIKQYFFKKYLDEKICTEEIVKTTYEDDNHLIVCSPEIKQYLNLFPKIYFFTENFQYIINLDYNDVFVEYNNKIYFLIMFKEALNTLWRVGKILLKKYPLIFDYDQRTISFVHLKKFGKLPDDDTKNKKTQKNNNIFLNYKIYIVFVLLIIAVVLGIFIGKALWQKKRKIRANELDDNCEYIEKFDIDK